jgi:preprotein translocase subunit SecA
MAGRGTDILLGGNPDFQTRQQIFEFLNQLNNSKFSFLLTRQNFSKIVFLEKNDFTFLEENVLGPGRYARPSFRLREGLKPNIKYSKVYFKGNKIIGSITCFSLIYQLKFAFQWRVIFFRKEYCKLLLQLVIQLEIFY